MRDFNSLNTSSLTSPQPKVLKTNKLFLIFLGIVLAMLATAQPARTGNTNYYVSPSGNDNNPGTLQKPWRHISYVADNNIVQPGDTIYIRGGNYPETIKQNISGAPGKPITYINYPGETPVITDDGSGTKWRWQILDQSHLRIEGITFKNFKGGALQIRTVNQDITDIAVVRSTFQNQSLLDNGNSNKTVHVTSYTSGQTLSHISFDSNQFLNLDTGSPPANEVLMFSGNVEYSEIINNTFAEASNIAIDLAGRPDMGQPHHILIKGNDVSNFGLQASSAAGIYVDAAREYILIEDNVVYNGTRGIAVNLEEQAASLQTRYVIIRRNVLYNNGINLKMGAAGVPDNCAQSGELTSSVAVHNTIYSDKSNVANHYFSCGTNLRWQNNIFSYGSSNSGYQYSLVNNTVDPTTWVTDYNLFQNAGGWRDYYRWNNGWYDLLSAFQQASNQDAHSLEGNPKFIDAANRNFRLQANSPARDAGGPLTFVTNTGSGTVIPVDTIWYFSDGLGIQTGDVVQIGSNAPVTIVAVNYATKRITVNASISWHKYDPVSYQYIGAAPDMGAYEFSNLSPAVYLPIVFR